jgi:hypothetical protein
MEAATVVTPLATQRTRTPSATIPRSPAPRPLRIAMLAPHLRPWLRFEEAEIAPAAGIGRIALRRTPTPVPSTTTEVR